MSNISLSKIGESENAVAMVDSRYPHRWVDAYGLVDKCIIDTVWKADEWTITATATSPVTPSVLPNSIALVTTPATDFAGDNMQVVGSRFKMEAGYPMYFGAKVTISDATQSDLVVGLFGVDTTLTAVDTTHALNISAGGVGFTKLDAVTALHFKTFTTATEKNTASVGVMNTAAHIYEIYWDGAAVFGYYDGVLVTKFTADITTEVLTPSIAFRAGAAAAKTCTVGWVRCIQVRG